jgi:hypothetical protein
MISIFFLFINSSKSPVKTNNLWTGQTTDYKKAFSICRERPVHGGSMVKKLFGPIFHVMNMGFAALKVKTGDEFGGPRSPLSAIKLKAARNIL